MTNWKLVAVIMLILFVVENILFIIAYRIAITEEERIQEILDKEQEITLQCYYEFCKGFADASFDPTTNVCTCYDYDVLGYLIPVEEGLIK